MVSITSSSSARPSWYRCRHDLVVMVRVMVMVMVMVMAMVVVLVRTNN
jgi:hypothetical protein